MATNAAKALMVQHAMTDSWPIDRYSQAKIPVTIHHCRGPFVVHRPLDRSRRRWAVSHLATWHLVCHVRTLADANAMIAELLPFNWNFDVIDQFHRTIGADLETVRNIILRYRSNP